MNRKENFPNRLIRLGAIGLLAVSLFFSPFEAEVQASEESEGGSTETCVILDTGAEACVSSEGWQPVPEPIQAAATDILNGNPAYNKGFILPVFDRQILGDNFHDLDALLAAQYCGSPLIDDTYLALENHCRFRLRVTLPEGGVTFEEMLPADICFGFGSSDLRKIAQTGSIQCASEMHVYEIDPEEHYGLAIAELANPIDSDTIVYAHLPDASDGPVVGDKVVAYGWGVTEETRTPTQLQEGNITVNQRETCNLYQEEPLADDYFYGGDGFPTENDGTPKVDTDHGDSSGPVMKSVVWNQVLAGLVAYGVQQRIEGVWNPAIGDPYYACGVYTGITQFMDEITALIGADELEKVVARADMRLIDGSVTRTTFFANSVLSNDPRAWAVLLQSPLYELDSQGNLIQTSKASYQSYQDGTIEFRLNEKVEPGKTMYAFLTVTNRSGSKQSITPLLFVSKNTIFIPLLASE